MSKEQKHSYTKQMTHFQSYGKLIKQFILDFKAFSLRFGVKFL